MDTAVDPQVVRLLLSGIIVMLLLALALVAFFLSYQKRLVSQQLTLQTLQATYQRELLAAVVAAEEQERQRIGSDLHDGIGSSLSAATVLLEQLGQPPTASAREQEAAGLTRGLLRQSLQEIRDIARNLHPVILTRFGLAKALHSLQALYGGAFARGLEVRVELAAVLAPAQELALYRIVQELISNILKHAQASQARVELVQQPPGLVLTVADDGCGFDPGPPGASPATVATGLGLKSLAARVSLLGATLHLHSAPGQGTTARVEMPLGSPAPQ